MLPAFLFPASGTLQTSGAVFAKETSIFDVQQVLHAQKYGSQFLVLINLSYMFCPNTSLFAFYFIPIFANAVLLKADAHFRQSSERKKLVFA